MGEEDHAAGEASSSPSTRPRAVRTEHLFVYELAEPNSTSAEGIGNDRYFRIVFELEMVDQKKMP
jgi:hypothetical protein